jgi:hypothetical protein
MNALIDSWGARNVGIALLVVAALFFIAAAMISWEAIQRGMGILALERAQAAALGGDRRGTVEDGRAAAGWLPREPAANLIALDLTTTAAGSELERLLIRLPPKNRPTAAAMLALHRMHHGGTVDQVLAAGDDAIVNHLRKLAPGGIPGKLSLPDSEPPQAPLLAYAAQRRFAAAWASGDVNAIRMTAGELRLLMPQHREITGVTFVLSTLTPSVEDAEIRTLGNRLPTGALRELILLKCMTLAPARTEILKSMMPAGGTP